MKRKPFKTCPACSDKCHARKATCVCGHVFYERKNRNKVIENWRSLNKGDVIKSVSGNGPYWENPATWKKFTWGHMANLLLKMLAQISYAAQD